MDLSLDRNEDTEQVTARRRLATTRHRETHLFFRDMEELQHSAVSSQEPGRKGYYEGVGKEK